MTTKQSATGTTAASPPPQMPMWAYWKRHLIRCADCTAGETCGEGRGILGSARPEDAPWLAPSPAIALIAAERQRQIGGEGWTPEHDDAHTKGELAEAAAAYTIPPHGPEREGSANVPPAVWPWSAEYWKPTPKDRVRELVKAGALIVAEIERLQRAARSVESDGGHHA